MKKTTDLLPTTMLAASLHAQPSNPSLRSPSAGTISAEPSPRPVFTTMKALADGVTRAGKLEPVQPVGADPKHFEPAHADFRGVGAFLLAGHEKNRLAAGK